MGKFKNALTFIADVGSAMAERNEKIEDMTRMIIRKGYDIDPFDAKKVAEVLVDHAEVTWK